MRTPAQDRRGTVLRGARGSAALEAVIGVPAFLLLIGLLVAGGRVATAQQAVQAAASDAARAASIARTQTAARTDATVAARHSLVNQDVTCATSTVTVDTAAFGTPVGTPGQVSATVSCTVPLGDLGLPISGSRTISSTMFSALDTHRER